MPNAELIRRTIAYIINHPDTWDQDWYEIAMECGTVRCFAGHAIALHYNVNDIFADLRKHLPIHLSAARVLGLNPDQADRLFYEYNVPLSQYVRLVQDVTGVDLSDLMPADVTP